MHYIQNNLLQNEKLLYAVRPHWVIFSSGVWAIVFAIYFWLFSDIASLNMAVYANYSARDILAAGLFLMGAYWFLRALIFYKNAEYGVTDKRVIVKIGWIHRESLELMLDKVEGVLVDQNISGRLLGYGTITVVGTGGTKDSYQFISHPLRFRKEVQQAVENSEERFRPR
ncbi:MAG: PH domain-containing protein [Coxiellaceae bacterium]|nr:PH domain-containing protein [Coxiellaceae bacterium]